MSKRGYYTDPYTMHFTAQITERLTVEARPAVVLDHTFFYPTSGGQPYDTGTLNDVSVVDVYVREADNTVVHVLDAPLDAADAVNGAIDWPRRFDHMQQHTGQHILTQAFIQTADAPTVSFHLGSLTTGSEPCTIDLDAAALTPAQIDAAEDLANQIVMQNLPVEISFPGDAEAEALALRKVPEVAGQLRVVSIGGFDVTACGGTHVAHTGEIGLIKVVRTEKYKNLTRVEFVCGQRALADYREKNAILLALANDLTTSYRDVGLALDKLRADNKAALSALKTARQALLSTEAQALLDATPSHDGLRVIVRAWAEDEHDMGELRQLASQIVAQPGAVALLGAAGEKAQVVLARAADVPTPDMAALLRATLDALTDTPGQARGGGRPDFAQGGGCPADTARLTTALTDAAAAVKQVTA